MESLALVVAALISLILFTGPVSLMLTGKLFWNFTRRNKAVWIIRRMLLTFISLSGMTISVLFIFNPLPATPKLMAVFGLALNVIALKREFLRQLPWSMIFRPFAKNPNGPSEQI
ncbi:MAG: hypothetical protein QNL07_00650 [Candidatus Planktophila sp.]